MSNGFNAAVEDKVRQEARRGRDGSVTVQGRRVPPGLAWADFVGHAGIQAELRERMQLPASVVVATNYTGPEFTAQFYKPLVLKIAKEQLGQYTAPLDTFKPGGSNEHKPAWTPRALSSFRRSRCCSRSLVQSATWGSWSIWC